VLREYGYGDMLFNYGCIPQTWEDPHKRHEMTGTLGDNDPIDVVDIGSKMWTCGSLVAVKVLGVLGMIDSGETDWKVRRPLLPALSLTKHGMRTALPMCLHPAASALPLHALPCPSRRLPTNLHLPAAHRHQRGGPHGPAADGH